jgi:hypothetical protein
LPATDLEYAFDDASILSRRLGYPVAFVFNGVWTLVHQNSIREVWLTDMRRRLTNPQFQEHMAPPRLLKAIDDFLQVWEETHSTPAEVSDAVLELRDARDRLMRHDV